MNVYSWGLNEDGQLGLGHNNNVSIPTIMNELKNEKIKYIFSGYYHNFCLNGISFFFHFIIYLILK
jgi:alpha-tubulin suppressor-like RCC1 family protein